MWRGFGINAASIVKTMSAISLNGVNGTGEEKGKWL
jgi:hypothetical protein